MLIGVQDDGEILGLANDFSLFRQPPLDNFELALTSLVLDCIGKKFVQLVGIDFEDIDLQQYDNGIFLFTIVSENAAYESEFGLFNITNDVGNKTSTIGQLNHPLVAYY